MSDENDPQQKPNRQNNVALLIDWDNIFITISGLVGEKRTNPLRLLDAIDWYAKKHGNLIWSQLFLTQRSDDLDLLIRYCDTNLEMSVNVVPPKKDAADREIKKTVEQVCLPNPNVRSIVLAGRDAAAFRPLCEALRAADKDVYVVTPGSSSGGMQSVATNVISLFAIVKHLERQGKSAPQKKNREIYSPAYAVQAKLAVIKLRNKEEPRTPIEKFVCESMEAIKAILAEKRLSSLTFGYMKEQVWEKLKKKWEKNDFQMDAQCKYVLNLFIEFELLVIVKTIERDTKRILYFVPAN